ncbi:MAG TPA: Coq4 family protein [Stellaceae bacterium]|nr:Coq4 family protein [Stellaceae bacterium]
MPEQLPLDTRLHPIIAFRALRQLIRNREDTRQVFVLVAALRGKSTVRQLARLRRSEEGRALLARRPSLLAALSDRDSLAKMPEGSLGRTYYDFVTSENLSAEGLVEASKIRDAPPPADELTWFGERGREMHDLMHVTAGYGRDPLGEVCVVAFTFAQNRQKGLGVIAVVGALRTKKRLRDQPIWSAAWQAYRQGRRAKWLFEADWENLLPRPLDEVRARYGITLPTYYPRILPVFQRYLAAAAAAGQTPAEAAAM